VSERSERIIITSGSAQEPGTATVNHTSNTEENS